jgi:hypothetical protein
MKAPTIRRGTDASAKAPKRDRRPLDAGDETPTPEAPIPLDTVPRDLSAESLAGPLAARPNGFRR